MSARPWQVWHYRPGRPAYVLTTFATRLAALERASEYNGKAQRAGVPYVYAVRRRRR